MISINAPNTPGNPTSISGHGAFRADAPAQSRADWMWALPDLKEASSGACEIFALRQPREGVVNTTFLSRLINSSQLIEQHANLEEGLTELARMTAELIHTDRCSIMLLSEPLEGEQEARLRIFAHFGPLPPEALREAVQMSKGIAGHVLTTRTPLLVPDIAKSPFVQAARFKNSGNPSLISVPIEVASQPIGVMNVKGPSGGPRLTEKDLELITIFAMFIGKSIQTFQLQQLAESRILQMAILRERQQQAQGSASQPIAPEPARIAKLVAKSLYQELTGAGFGPNDVITVTSEVLSLLHLNLKQRREQEAS